MSKIKLRELESILEDVETFEAPKILLEQYATPPHIAACMLHSIQSSYGDIRDKHIADLGCGTGVLSIGSAILGAGSVVGFDIDSEALSTCRQNIEEFEIDNVDLVQCDISELAKESNSRLHKKFDTVVLNPPFGTKRNWGLDLMFVQSALALSRNSVYSLHKTSTREHILKKAEDWGVKATVLAQLRYNLKGGKYKHHKKEVVDIEVDFYRFSHK